MKYKSELINEIVENEGHCSPSLHYESECISDWLESIRGAYPKLCDYEGEWLDYYLENNGIGKFPYLAINNIISTTIENTVPIPFKSAILKGNTKYRDIDTGEVLDAFEDGRNLELVSVKMPVLTTSNEDGTKTNILTVNEDVELRGIGDVKDELNLLTGELTQRIGVVVLDENITGYHDSNYSVNGYSAFRVTLNDNIPIGLSNVICDKVKYYPNLVLDWTKQEEFFTLNGNLLFVKFLSTKASNFEELRTFLSSSPITIQYELAESIKTVDLSINDESGNNVSNLKAMNGITHIETNGTPLNPTFSGEIPVEAIAQNLHSFTEEE